MNLVAIISKNNCQRCTPTASSKNTNSYHLYHSLLTFSPIRYSLPSKSLFILPLCLYIANIASINVIKKNLLSNGLFPISMTMGAANADKMEDKDTYLVV